MPRADAPSPRHARLIVALVVMSAVPALPTSASGEVAARQNAALIQAVVDDLRARLAIAAEVVVEVVPSNVRLVSVARIHERDAAFRLSVEDGFLDGLTPEERAAVLAHELGHVWIFTHHPYLHTEQLANRIAMRVVSRESLAGAYQKMWTRIGTNGDLALFLGEAVHPVAGATVTDALAAGTAAPGPAR